MTTDFLSRPDVPDDQYPAVEGEFWSLYDGTRQPYVLECGGSQPGGVVIALHGHGSDRHQFLNDTLYGGSLGALKQALRKRNIALATLDYRGKTSWLSPAAESDIGQLFALLVGQLGITSTILIGGSMGGSAAVAFAARNPQYVAGVIALCPATDIGEFYKWCRDQAGGTPHELADAIEQSHGRSPNLDPAYFAGLSAFCNLELPFPVVLAHGDADGLIPVDNSRRLARALKTAGTDVLYDEISGGDHDAPVVQANWDRWLNFVVSHINKNKNELGAETES
jgi:pimeloyl-ACP methyl ester carboxylesterase